MKNTKEKAITLIALVITIIVLIILAGVSINLVLGENGLLKEAKKAVEDTKIANVKEQIELSVLTSTIDEDNPSINTGKLKDELDKLLSKKVIDEYESNNGEIELPCKVTKDNYEFTIEEDGNVTIKDIVEEEITVKPNENLPENSNTQVITNYGKIDVIWLNGITNNPSQKPNAPILESGTEKLTAVKFEKNENNGGHNNWVPADETNKDNDWYNYQDNGDSTARETEGIKAGQLKDNISSKWANARTANNSYFVWIPRFAYRITYYESETSTEPTGYYDGYGLWEAKNGQIKYELDKGIEKTIYNGQTYIVHPAFTDESDIGYANGGWNTDLQGFWFAKFEMGESTPSNLNSTFGTASIRGQNVGVQYENARKATFGYNGTEDKEDGITSFMHSHMSKNSEWGAVAYLTHSQYGRNGNEIEINSNGGNYYRGGGTGDQYIEKTLQSSTGNVYGIYDLSGNASERVAIFNAKGSESVLSGSSYAGNMTKYAKNENNEYISTKYITAYTNDSDANSGTVLYNIGKIGDGTKEVYQGTSLNGWLENLIQLCIKRDPIIVRGGYYNDGSVAGIFCSRYYYDSNNGYCTFRVVLCP